VGLFLFARRTGGSRRGSGCGAGYSEGFGSCVFGVVFGAALVDWAVRMFIHGITVRAEWVQVVVWHFHNHGPKHSLDCARSKSKKYTLPNKKTRK
jgi:hypothetical protein